MTPQSVLIRHGDCKLVLILPDYFGRMPLTKTRGVFKLLRGRPDQNVDACEQLDRFFPVWERSLKDALAQRRADLAAALKQCGAVIAAYEAHKR